MSVDFPAKLINNIHASGNRRVYEAIESLIADGYVKRYRKDKIGSLRLTKKGQSYLESVNKERFGEAVLSKRKYSKSELKKRIRIHRIAATYLMMKNSGIKIYKDQKPKLFSEDERNIIEIKEPVFYSSGEIKSFGIECTKIKFTRAVGVMLIEADNGFIVYNAENTLMKWSSQAEQKLHGVISGILLKNSIQIDNFSAIMMGNNMDSAKKQLLSKGGPRNCYFKLDNTFNEFYFVPETRDGEFLLRLLSSVHERKFLKEKVLDLFNIDNNSAPFVSDGVDSKERMTLLAYTFDMERIRKFKSAIEMFEEPALVICFDFQRKVLEGYFGNLAQIEVIDRKWVAQELGWCNEA